MRSFVRQIGNIKTVLTIPWATMDALETGGNARRNITKESDLFERVPLVFRALRKRCDTLTSVPYVFSIGGKEEVEYPYESELPFHKLLWYSEASLLFRGGAFLLRLLDANGMEVGLQTLNPFTMEIKSVGGELHFTQRIGGQTFPKTPAGYWTEEEMIFMREFSPSEDIGFGTSACSVAMEDGRLENYFTRFTSQFFASGAMPVTMLGLPAGTGSAEVTRVQDTFKKLMQGIRNAFRIVAVSGEVKPAILTPEFKSLDMDKLSARTISNISWAFDIPKSVLTADSANYATAEMEYKTFINDTIIPRTKFFESALKSFFADHEMEFKFKPQELSIMQEDESNRAIALKALVDAGVPLKHAFEILGYDLTDDYKNELATQGNAPISISPSN